jgi:hypothetical protein
VKGDPVDESNPSLSEERKSKEHVEAKTDDIEEGKK